MLVHYCERPLSVVGFGSWIFTNRVAKILPPVESSQDAGETMTVAVIDHWSEANVAAPSQYGAKHPHEKLQCQNRKFVVLQRWA